MSSFNIAKEIASGKYVSIQHAVLTRITDPEHPHVISFDAKVCKDVYGWNESCCNGEISGNIKLHSFPAGYLPDLYIGDIRYRYNDEYNNNMMLVVADSEELYNSWQWYESNKSSVPPSQFNRRVYKWSTRYESWEQKGSYRDTNLEHIQGLEKELHAILSDVKMIVEKREMLNKLGLSPSVNYLLESQPGMGKTSLIRAIATSLNCDIHVISANALESCTPCKLFASYQGVGKPTIYIFEDFDRYLNTSKSGQMAAILNALDGVENMPESLRFFTCNSDIRSQELQAFISRMRRCIKIDHHDAGAYLRSVKTVYPDMPEKEVDRLVSLFTSHTTTMRVANNLLCASVVYDNAYEYIENHLWSMCTPDTTN